LLKEDGEMFELVYKPRNDNVIIRVVVVEESRGIAMPQNSVQGKKYVVVAFGENVKELVVGDRVFLTGVQKVDWDFLPNSHDLLIVKEANVLTRIEEVDHPEVPTKTDGGFSSSGSQFTHDD